MIPGTSIFSSVANVVSGRPSENIGGFAEAILGTVSEIDGGDGGG